MISPYIAEFIGTAILLLLGSGIVANVSLSKTKGFDQTPLLQLQLPGVLLYLLQPILQANLVVLT